MLRETTTIKIILYYDNEDILNVRELFNEYSKSLGFDISYQNLEEEFEQLQYKYGAPDGVTILASLGVTKVGCVAVRKMSDDVCEMKRLYVGENYRGYGVAKKIVTLAIKHASRLRYKCIRLDTLSSMTEAIKLYENFGFYYIDAYIHNPFPEARYMELKVR